MEPNICESIGELGEGHAVENLAQPMLRQPLILRHQERHQRSLVFEFEDEEDDLDLFDDGEDDYFEDEIYKLVQSYVPTTAVTSQLENVTLGNRNEGTHHFDLTPKLAECFEETEKNMIDLNETGTVKKEIIRPGNGVKVPESSRLYYHYMAVVEGLADIWDLSVTRKYPKYADLKNTSHLLVGFEIALRSMEMNEVSRFIVSASMAYGEIGCPPHIPANKKIMYVVETLHFIDENTLKTPFYMALDERSELPFQAVCEAASKLCSEGNRWYDARSDCQLAIKKWQKGIQLLEEYPSANATPVEVKRKSQLLHFMFSNSAQAYLKLGKPAQACSACEQGLQFAEEESSINLLYRFSKAKLMLKDCDGALQLVEQGLRISKNDADLLRLENEIYFEDACQRGVFKTVCAEVSNSASTSTIRISPQQGPSGVGKGSDLQMKGEEKSSLKGSDLQVKEEEKSSLKGSDLQMKGEAKSSLRGSDLQMKGEEKSSLKGSDLQMKGEEKSTLKGSDLQLKGEEKSSLKGSPARSLRNLFTKKKTGNK